jgi:FkbM family methyltransferase
MNLFKSLSSKVNTIYRLFRLTGPRGVLVYKPIFQPVLRILSAWGLVPETLYIKLDLKGYSHPVYARYGSSDLDVLYQVFIEKEYSCLDDLQDAKVILDCGANVGYTSVYLLNQYNAAHVMAIEPDDENIKVFEKNLAPYSSKVSLVRSGIWSHKTGLSIDRGGGDGREWAIQVKETQVGQEPDLYARDISDLLKTSGFQHIDILKMDIEGSEAVVFSKNYDGWLCKVRNIAIELHGKNCEKTFFKALAEYNYKLSTQGELTVCKELSLKENIASNL